MFRRTIPGDGRQNDHSLWNGRFEILELIERLEPSRLGICWIVLGDLNLLREAQLEKHPDAPEVRIEFIPLEAMTCRNRMRVVVIVPAFSARKQRNPPTVA